MSTTVTNRRLRWGRKVGRTLYEDDVFVGCVDSADLAKEIVGAVNMLRSGELTDENARVRAALLAVCEGNFAPCDQCEAPAAEWTLWPESPEEEPSSFCESCVGDSKDRCDPSEPADTIALIVAALRPKTSRDGSTSVGGLPDESRLGASRRPEASTEGGVIIGIPGNPYIPTIRTPEEAIELFGMPIRGPGGRPLNASAAAIDALADTRGVVVKQASGAVAAAGDGPENQSTALPPREGLEGRGKSSNEGT